MKLVKGILIGTAVATAVGIMYSEGLINKKKIMRKGRKMAKKMGIFI